MAIDISPLHPHFVAEVRGADLAKPIEDTDFRTIETAFEEHSVLVFRNQSLDQDAQIAFSERFGPLETTIKGAMGEGSKVVVLSNVDPESGRLLPMTDKRWVRLRANELWHTDSSFKRVPAKASMLYGQDTPAEGGNTEFASLRAAWNALPADRQRMLEDLVAIHDFSYSRRVLGEGFLTREQKAEVPPVPQVMVRENPVNGRRNFYIASHASHVAGWPLEKGRALIDELTELATRPEFVYAHKWHRHDLVLWDNRAVMHRARPFRHETDSRIMVRTTVAGEGPTVSDEWLARMNATAAE